MVFSLFFEGKPSQLCCLDSDCEDKIKIMIEIMEVDQSKSVIDHRLSLKFPKLIVAMSHQLKPLFVTLNFNGLAVLRFLADNNGAILDIMPLTLIKRLVKT
jgi:hypothetical protein